MKTYNLAILEKAIRVAAEEAYQNEIIDAHPEESNIGEVYRMTWIETKIEKWIEEAKER